MHIGWYLLGDGCNEIFIRTSMCVAFWSYTWTFDVSLMMISWTTQIHSCSFLTHPSPRAPGWSNPQWRQTFHLRGIHLLGKRWMSHPKPHPSPQHLSSLRKKRQEGNTLSGLCVNNSILWLHFAILLLMRYFYVLRTNTLGYFVLLLWVPSLQMQSLIHGNGALCGFLCPPHLTWQIQMPSLSFFLPSFILLRKKCVLREEKSHKNTA